MNCPRCETVPLTERERAGILVDACSRCRGIWLDRGELEKLIARGKREFDEMALRRDDTPPRGTRYREDHEDDDDYDHDRRQPVRKRRWIDSLGDLFD